MGGQYGPCRPCRCLLCPCFPLVFSHHLTRVPAREEVGEGGGIEDRELHLKTLELAAWGCGAWRGATFPKPAALFSLLTPFSPPHLSAPISQEWNPESGPWGCPLLACTTRVVYMRVHTSACVGCQHGGMGSVHPGPGIWSL